MMERMKIFSLSVCFIFLSITNKAQEKIDPYAGYRVKPATVCDSLNIDLIIPTFLGNEQRNYYGNQAPSKLDVKWKFYLGQGKTVISRSKGERVWAGAGWTGQPLLATENGRLILIQGAFNHQLYKIDAESVKVIWKYQFDDVVKGTGTIWENVLASEAENAYVILQGSRLGVGNYLDYDHIPSYRAISFTTGKELWRHDSKWTDSYSRDVDASALILNDTAYIGLENSLFTVFDPDYKKAEVRDSMLQPKIYRQLYLYEQVDVATHKNNIVTEASPCLLGDHIYVASGSGHVYGFNLKTNKLDWDFYIGSDMDGSPVVTSDSCIVVSVEKQFIKGKGGAMKLDPSKSPGNAVVWYYPVDDKKFAGWEGGIIGSVSVNDRYTTGDRTLCAFTGIDGYLYVVKHKMITADSVPGPDSISMYPKPELVFRYKTGPSISTPIIVKDKLIAAGYGHVFLFEYDDDLNFTLLDKFAGPFEATPVVHNNHIYLACRDGYLYCFGEL